MRDMKSLFLVTAVIALLICAGATFASPVGEGVIEDGNSWLLTRIAETGDGPFNHLQFQWISGSTFEAPGFIKVGGSLTWDVSTCG